LNAKKDLPISPRSALIDPISDLDFNMQAAHYKGFPATVASR
jgi:hypothetical protein